MVSIETIQRSFDNFVDEASKRNGKEMNDIKLSKYLREIELYSKLFKEKAFVKEVEKLEWVYKLLKNKRVFDSSILKKLKEILVSISK